MPEEIIRRKRRLSSFQIIIQTRSFFALLASEILTSAS